MFKCDKIFLLFHTESEQGRRVQRGERDHIGNAGAVGSRWRHCGQERQDHQKNTAGNRHEHKNSQQGSGPRF